MSRILKPRVGYTDLLHQPEDGRRYEIYDGEVFVVPSPLPVHQIVAARLLRALEDHAHEHGGVAIPSPIDIVFSEHNVLQPDVVFFSAARRHLIKLDEPIRVAPDLLIEVLSASTEATDRGRKLQTYARFGVPEYWIVDPHALSVEVLKLSDRGYSLHSKTDAGGRVTSATLPELTFDADDLTGF